MNEKELFIEVVNNLNNQGIYMNGTLVYYNEEPQFNTDGYNFAYNMMRLGKLIEEVVDFR